MKIDFKRAKIMAAGLSVCFLLIHILLINMFYRYEVWPMVRFNVFSVIFYAASLGIAYMGWLRLFAWSVYLEVALHMTLAVIFTGWESGFQVTLIGMNVLAFYAEYVGRTLKIKYFPMMPLGILGMMLYTLSYVYVHFIPAPYPMPEYVEFWMSITCGVVVFAINLFVLQIFVMVVHSYELKLEHQMSHDKLTGLPNRYHMSNHLNEIQANEGLRDYWIAIGDIDNFKKVNDTYGHNCGDYVLKTVASLTHNQDDILCCRWGGEEFIFMGRITGNYDRAYEWLNELRKKVATYPLRFEDTDLRVTMTFGLAAFSDDPPATRMVSTPKDIDTCISEADAKLYQGKQSGKNQVVR